MKRKAVVLAFFLAASLSAHPLEDWKGFASNQGRFTVLFPGPPGEEKSVVNTEVGKVDLYQYSISGGDTFYMVAFSDYPPLLRSADDLLDATVKAVLKSLGGDSSGVQRISLDGHPGRSARAEGPRFSVAARIFWVHPRLYQLLAVAPKGKLDLGGADRFLGSFHVQAVQGAPTAPTAAPAPPPNGVLRITSQPTAVEVYLDDKRRGITGAEEGRLVLDDLAPGSYRLRLSLAGYKDWAQTVTLAAGQTTEIQAVMKVAGPGAFTLQDVVDMLRGEISPKRVATLVQQRGVDFALTDAVEKQIREAGGDSDLLVAIAKARK